MKMRELQTLSAEVLTLVREGRYTQADFERLYPKFKAAAAGQFDAMPALINHTPEEWFAAYEAKEHLLVNT